jgi:hypothetical protein
LRRPGEIELKTPVGGGQAGTDVDAAINARLGGRDAQAGDGAAGRIVERAAEGLKRIAGRFG